MYIIFFFFKKKLTRLSLICVNWFRLVQEWETKRTGEVALVEGNVETDKEGSDAGATTAFTISTNHGHTPSNVSPERSTAELTANSKPPPPLQPPSTPVVQTKPKRDAKKESIEAKRERKAAKTLAIITGAFVVCWLPFFIMALLMPLCHTCYINENLASLFLWLGYFNSTLNPVIYTIFSPDFRQAFKRILCGVSHSRPRNLR